MAVLIELKIITNINAMSKKIQKVGINLVVGYSGYFAPIS